MPSLTFTLPINPPARSGAPARAQECSANKGTAVVLPRYSSAVSPAVVRRGGALAFMTMHLDSVSS
jgi:hypothetical protein